MFFRERQQITICVAAVAMIGVFVVFRYLPLHKRVKVVKETKAAKALANSMVRTRSEQVPVLEEQLEKLQQVIGDYQARIPSRRSAGAFLGKITELMNEHNLKEQVIEPREEIKTEELNCIPVNMRCKGRLAQVFEFYKRLQTLDRLVRIEQIKLTNDTDFTGEVTMETRAVIYYAARGRQG